MDDASTAPYQSKPLSRTIWLLYVKGKAEIMMKIVYKSYQFQDASFELLNVPEILIWQYLNQKGVFLCLK